MKNAREKRKHELTNINGISNLTKSAEKMCELMFYRPKADREMESS